MSEDFIICVSSEPRMQTIGPGDGIPDDLGAELLEDLQDLAMEPSQVRLEIGSAGYGAEILTVLEIIGGILAIGPLIDQNLTAWPRIGRRLARVLAKQRGKGYGVSVSEPAALALSLAEMERRGISIDNIRLVAEHILPVRNSSVPVDLAGSFSRHPDRFYLFLLRASDGDTYVITVRSSGGIEDIKRLSTGDFMEFAGIRRRED